MGTEDYKIVKNFISYKEVKDILTWIDTLKNEEFKANHHLTELSKTLNGASYIFDISQTKETEYITNFQSIGEVRKEPLPDFIMEIIDRISTTIGLPKNHLFLQAVDMKKGGKIDPHYDAAFDGLINYKCNVSVLSEDYNLYLDKTHVSVQQKDLYCFEASLYKHWTNEFNSRRVFLSFGFLIPYNVTGRDENDPRVRLSQRIQKYFQQL
jgi:hypothetical protein